MAELMTIARPYAQAAFSAAKEGNSLSKWSEELANLAMIASDEAMAKMIANPAYATSDMLSVFDSVLGSNLSKEAKNFLNVLSENKRLAALPIIAEAYEELRAIEEKRVRATVISAQETTVEQKKQLSAALNAKFDAEVDITYEEDPSLIAGIQIKVGDWAIDGSAVSKLNKLGAAIAQ